MWTGHRVYSLAKTQVLCDAQIYLYNVNKRQQLSFLSVAPQRDEIFKQKVNDCDQHIILQNSPISTEFGHRDFRIFPIRQDGPLPTFFAPPAYCCCCCYINLPTTRLLHRSVLCFNVLHFMYFMEQLTSRCPTLHEIALYVLMCR